MLDFYRFKPVYVHTLWGGDKLSRFKHAPVHDLHGVGESWELSGIDGNETVVAHGPDAGLTPSQLIGRHGAALVGDRVLQRFGCQLPLLVKFISTREQLSVQVHPRGKKNEMWYVVAAEPHARIRLGFSRDMQAAEVGRLVADGSIADAIACHDSRAGDAYYIPAGQIHTIGAGNLIAEIQQPCTITYRINDFGRRDAQGNLRQLHVAEALRELSLEAYDGRCPYAAQPGLVAPVVACPSFEVERLQLDGSGGIDWAGEEPRFHVLMCVGGSCQLDDPHGHSTMLRQGETVLAPATMRAVTATGDATLLIATV